MEWMRPFGLDWQDRLQRGLEESADDERRVAVFDADGTLWDGDIGEAFLRWLIAMRKLKHVDYYTDIYGDYEARVAQDRATGYAHAVQLMADLELKDIKRWSAALAWAWPGYRPAMAALAEGLRDEGFETWIVSATNHWTVGEAGPYAGIPTDRCLGIRCYTRVEKDGEIVTPRVERPITCNQGKVEAIERHIGVRPVFAFGDSSGDLEMLAYSRFPLVIQQYGHERPDFVRLARERNWPVHIL